MKTPFVAMASSRLGLLISIILFVSPGCAIKPAASRETTFTPSSLAAPPLLAGSQLPSSILPVYPSGTATIEPAKTPAPDVVLEMLSEVDSDRVITNLKRLTGEEPICNENECHTIASRLTGSEELGWAKDYVSRQLSGLGYSVEFSDWSGSGFADQDILVRKAGMSLPNEEVYFVAHLDSVRRLPGIPFPAADDDASGVADLLELARVLSTRSFSRTVVLLFSTGEEQGGLGVRAYLDKLSPEAQDAIRCVVDIDMIGYDGNGDGAMQLWSGDDAPSLALAQRLSKIVRVYQPALTPSVVTGCT